MSLDRKTVKMSSNIPHAALQEAARRHNVFVPADSPYQRQVRLLQALWREERKYPIGDHRGPALGSRLKMPWAQRSLANYLTPTIGRLVACEFDNRNKLRKLYGYPRLFDDLLSSQPLCFNLFGELKADFALATAVLRDLTKGVVEKVTRLEFEHSPGRGDRRFSGDHSAFDVYVEFVRNDGGRGFMGFEVKYHEDLSNPPAPHRPRYDEVAKDMGCFLEEKRAALQAKPLQQLWRDHLLAGSLTAARKFDSGQFVIIYPSGNTPCATAVNAYRECLSDDSTFAAWTLEEVVAAISFQCRKAWVEDFDNRYLRFSKLEKA